MPRQFLLAALFILLAGLPAWAQEKSDPRRIEVPEVEKNQSYPSNGIHHLSVRVIFAGQTGFVGDVPKELADMKPLLTQAFQYPGYTLSNTIRLSLLDDEEVVAQVFPNHFLRILPKGNIDGGIKIKAELYNAPAEDSLRAQLYVNAPNLNTGKKDSAAEPESENKPQPPQPLLGFNDRTEGKHSVLFPILSSAAAVTPQQWEAFGGVSVSVSGQDAVQSNVLSSSGFGAQSTQTRGAKKFLILGLKLEE